MDFRLATISCLCLTTAIGAQSFMPLNAEITAKLKSHPATQELKDDYTYDGAHLTPDGYTVFTKKIAAAIRKVLLDK